MEAQDSDMSDQSHETSIIPYDDSQNETRATPQRRTYPLLIVQPPRVLPPPILIPLQNQPSSDENPEQRQTQLVTLIDPLVQLFVNIQASAGRRIEASLHVPASMLRPGSLLFLPRSALMQASLRIVQNPSQPVQTENAQSTPESMELATPVQIAQEELSAALNAEGIYLLVANTSNDALSEDQFQELLNRLAQLHQPQGPPPAATSAIDALPVVEVTEQMVKEAHKCPICCDEFECGRPNVVKLPCSHLFDKDCVENWLKQHNTCPVCRYALPIETDVSPSTLPAVTQTQPQPSQLMDIEPTTLEIPPTITTPTPLQDAAPQSMDTESTSTNGPTIATPIEQQTEPEIVATIPSQKEKKLSGLKRGFLNQKKPAKEPKSKGEPFMQGLKRGFFK